MTDKILLMAIAVFVAILVIGFVTIMSSAKNTAIARKRLNELQMYDDDFNGNVQEKLGAAERLLNPVMVRLSGIIRRFSPDELIKTYELKILRSGEKNNTVSRLLGIKGFMALIVPSIAYLYVLKNRDPFSAIVGVIICALIGFYLPDIELNGKIKKRQERILTQIPFLYDLLCVCVDAGYGFDSALTEVSQRINNDLSKEFSRLLNEISVNVPLADALDGLYNRIGIDEIKQFTIAVKSTQELGAEIGSVLKVQAEMAHDKSRQRAQELAQKLPLKLLFPLVLFIFPTIFIILLAPAVFQMASAFGGM